MKCAGLITIAIREVARRSRGNCSPGTPHDQLHELTQLMHAKAEQSGRGPRRTRTDLEPPGFPDHPERAESLAARGTDRIVLATTRHRTGHRRRMDG